MTITSKSGTAAPHKVSFVLRPAALDIEQTAAYVSLSVGTVENLEREEDFPRRRKLSGRRVGYLLREIDEWLESRPVSDLLPPVNCQIGRGGKPA